MYKKEAYYAQNIPGFRVEWETICENGYHLLFMDNGSCVIELMPIDEKPEDGHRDHLTLLVSNLEELEELGIEFESESFNDDWSLYQNGERNLIFRGPDNERLQIEQIM